MGAGGSFGQRNEEKTRVNKGRNIFSASEIFGGREYSVGIWGERGIILLVIETQLSPDAAMHTRIVSIIASHLVILRISSC